MNRILIACLMTILLATAPAIASYQTFSFTFADTSLGGTATATGSITFDMSLLVNPGRNLFDSTATDTYAGDWASYGTNIPGLVTALSVTVSGASDGNGTFGLSKFDGVLFDTSKAGLDFSKPLVGQSVVVDGHGTGAWGTSANITGSNPSQSWTGDFQLFSPVYTDPPINSILSTAPSGGNPYQLTTYGGEVMQLTSMTAVPEPSTYVLLCIALGTVWYARRKMVKD